MFDEAFLKRLEYLHVVSKRVFSGRARADRRSKRIGGGIEFADHRAYVAGDDLRYLDWSVYGRLGRLLLRLFEEEEDLHIYLLLDTSASMATGAPPKFDYARQVVAALAYVGLANLDRVAVVPLVATAPRPPQPPPSRGRGRIFALLDQLAAARADGPTDLRAAIASFVRGTTRRGIAIVVSDFYDPAGATGGLDLLRHHRFEPIVIQLVDPHEAEPDQIGEVDLIDSETGEARPVTLSPDLLRRFAAAHEAHCRHLEAFCRQHGMHSFRALTSQPFDELILRVLRRGGLLA